jgi:putative ABC transport system permease protein
MAQTEHRYGAGVGYGVGDRIVLSDLLYRLRAIFRRNAVERELDDELRFHFERQVEKYVRSGLTQAEAARRARLEFGGLEQVKEECRWARGVSALESTAQDLRYAVRSMRRSPAFTLTAILTLVLTTGAVSTVFNLANTFFFRQLPLPHPEELVVVSSTRRHGTQRGWVSYSDYVHFRDGNKTLRGLAADYSTAPLFVTANNNSKEVNGAVVSANFFPLLGVTPALGRFFRPDEDRVPDRDYVAVLSHDLWRNWFGLSVDAVGAAIKINGVTFTVIGVTPQVFRGVSAMPAEVYIPTMMLRIGFRGCNDALDTECTVLKMIGRLAPGRTVEETNAEMATLVPAPWAKAPEGDNTDVIVYRDRGTGGEDELRFVRLLTLIAGVLLLVCCANLAGLLLARGAARARELAIRGSLGAARLRLMRQLMTESCLLAVVGGLGGLLLSLVLTRSLSSMFYSVDSEGHPLYYDFHPEPVVILAVLAVSLAAGCFFGLIPAVKWSSLELAESLKSQTPRIRGRFQLGHLLVGAQAAIAVALVCVAALLAASAQALATGINFEPGHVALMRVRPRLIEYSAERSEKFIRAVIRRLEALPSVESASMLAAGVALEGGEADVLLPEWPEHDRRGVLCGYIEVGPRYFETLRTPVVRGREFDERDTAKSLPVAIVNQAFASRFWPTGNVIDATVMANGQRRRIVGVVKDVPLQTRTENLKPYVYVPFWQIPGQTEARLCVRVRGDPAAILPLLEREIHGVDPDVPIAETITLPIQMAGIFRPLRVSAIYLAYAAALAVLLNAIGLYGTLAFTVSRRTKEIGIRMAVGAAPGSVLTMIAREGMTVVLSGIVTGMGLAMAGTRLIRHLLFESAAGDGLLYFVAGLVIAGTGLIACWVPARRAASVDPMTALRQD